VMTIGAITALFMGFLGIIQNDIKRVVAYSTLSQLGYMTVALGASAYSVAVFHLMTHAFFKALLFLGAGAVVHATGTREIDRLGGLLRRMPATAMLFLAGAVAICGLPPLNGFVSELFVYLGLFRAAGARDGRWWIATSFAAPALAMVGALAVACFVKVFGAMFLGEPRSADALRGHEPPRTMLAPMLALAACCLAIGLAPALVAPALDSASASWGVQTSIASAVPLGRITAAGAILLAAIALSATVLAVRVRRAAAGPTWDCGYAAPAARMQYTSSSFSQMLVGLFSFALRPRQSVPRIAGPFPARAAYHGDVPDVVLDRVLLPSLRTAGRALESLRLVQSGNLQSYLGYILLTLVLLLVWR